MSRAAASTKADKSKGGKSTSLGPPAVTREIIPGKLNDHEWSLMVDQDDSDQFGNDLVEEICEAALDIIYNKYIERQLEPYTSVWAKDALLQIIQWQFLERDEGETNLDVDNGWTQDEEPAPAIIDCWAQGAVPQQGTTPTIPEETEEEIVVEEEEIKIEDVAEADFESTLVESEVPKETTSTETKEQTELSGTSTEHSVVKHNCLQSDKEKSVRSSRSYRAHKGKLGSAKVSRMVESLDSAERLRIQEQPEQQPESPDPLLMLIPASCLSTMKTDSPEYLQLQAGRPPGNRDVFYDDTGNVVGMTRIHPAKLPTHRVSTTFRVIDPRMEAAQSRLDAMRTGKGGGMVPQPPSTKKKGARSGKKGKKEGSSGQRKSMNITLPPPLLESMEVAPGVVVKEGERVKKGPRKRHNQIGLSKTLAKASLQPVSMSTNLPSITMEQILGHHEAIIRPLSDAIAPIPPIQTQMGY